MDTYARSKFEDTRRKAQKFGARGTTVKAHVSRVLEKLELNNRVQVALLAHDAGEA